MPRTQGWRLLVPAAFWTAAVWGCQGPGLPETVQAPSPVCSFAATDIPRRSDVAQKAVPIEPARNAVPETPETGTIQRVSALNELSPVTPASAESAAIEAPVPVTAPAIAPPEGSGALTLDQAIAVGLQQNPTLVALRATQPVAEAALRVAQTYPFNPYVQVEVCPVDHELGTGQGAILNYVYLMQTLELAHQSRYREASAAAARNQVCWNVVHAELTNAAQTEKLYFTALYERDLRDLARLTAAQNERVLGIVERRFTAGTGMPTEQTTARVAARQSRKQAGLAESNFQTALLALKRQLNLDTNEPIALVGRLEDFNWMPVEGVEPDSADGTAPIRVSPQVVARLAGERPDVLAAQSGTSMAQANADLARANMVQNIAVGPYYERDDYGTLFLGLRAGRSTCPFGTPVGHWQINGRPRWPTRRRSPKDSAARHRWKHKRRLSVMSGRAAWPRANGPIFHGQFLTSWSGSATSSMPDWSTFCRSSPCRTICCKSIAPISIS